MQDDEEQTAKRSRGTDAAVGGEENRRMPATTLSQMSTARNVPIFRWDSRMWGNINMHPVCATVPCPKHDGDPGCRNEYLQCCRLARSVSLHLFHRLVESGVNRGINLLPPPSQSSHLPPPDTSRLLSVAMLHMKQIGALYIFPSTGTCCFLCTQLFRQSGSYPRLRRVPHLDCREMDLLT